MKLLFSAMLAMSAFFLMSNKFTPGDITTGKADAHSSNTLLLQPDPSGGEGRMRAVVFKNQEYCRAELKDFEFDIRFIIVSATVYFSGANFSGVEKGLITSSSLKPVKKLMERCLPGSIVTFDDVKVKGPDNRVRTIDGVTYRLF